MELRIGEEVRVPLFFGMNLCEGL
jgi:hypothetical protein